MFRTSLIIALLFFSACSQEFRVIKSNVNNNDNSFSITTTPIELALSGITDIYSYKVFMTLKYNHYQNNESYSMIIKYQGLSLLNLEKAYLEVDDNKYFLTSERPPVIKQDGVEYIAEIHSFSLSRENISTIILENDARLVFRTGQRIIDMPFNNEVKSNIKKFFEMTIED